MNKERYVWLDIARGICILLMVTCHANAYANQRWAYFSGITGVFFLIFFFVTAGFCFNTKKTLKEYVGGMFKKCIVPYVIVSAIYLAVNLHRHSIPGDGRLEKVINAAASLIWGLSNTFKIGPIQTIGMGPIWFLVLFFTSTVLFKCFGTKKYFGPVIFILTIISSLSQIVVTLPFTIQNTFIACMFIWIGYIVKNRYSHVIDDLRQAKMIKLILYSFGLLFGLFFCIWLGYVLANIFSGRFLDLGSNVYSIVSLPASLFGCALVVVIGVIIERTEILDEFLAFCGKETFLILILHDIDITMLRNWEGRDLTYLGFTLLGYPFAIYLFRRLMHKLKR